MQNFTFECKTKIIFGKNTEKEVGTEIKKFGKKVLLHYGGGHIKKNGLYQKVKESLEKEQIEVFELGGVKANPILSLVEEGIRICKENQIDVLLAVGGGSVIDSAKAIGVGALYDGPVWDFFEGKTPVERMLPLGVVLTIPATGSEASNTTVVTKEEGLLKRALAHTVLRPTFAIMNPELTYSLPAYQTAVGSIDIMSHVIERYFTQEKNVDFTDRLCEATLKTIIKNVPKAIENPNGYAARAEIMWAGTIAHNGLLGTGRSEDWASHMMGHEITALYDTAHGATLSIVIPQWMEYVYKENVDRFVQYAVRVWGVPIEGNKEEIAIQGIQKTKEFFESLDVPTSLHEIGIGNEKIEEMAEKCCAYGPIGGFKSLGKDDVIQIYKNAL